MKTVRNLFFLTLLSLLLLPSLSSAQAIIDNGYDVVFIYNKKGFYSEIKAYDTRSVVSPSGNVLKTARFQLPEGHPLIPSWSNRIIQVVLRDGNRDIICGDTHVTVNRKGHFTVIYHINGAGNLSPLGWPLVVK